MAVKFAPVWLGVPSPVPVTVTLAVDVAVDVPGAYCTMMVQVFPVVPGFRTVPDAQVPPVIENVPPAVPTLVMAGAAVKVNAVAPAPVAVFVTVIVPLLVVVLAGVVVSTGAGAEIVSVAPVIWNVPGAFMFPLVASTTVTVLAVSPAVAPIAQEALTVVAVAVTPVQLTPAPLMVTPVAPARPAPLITSGTVAPC